MEIEKYYEPCEEQGTVECVCYRSRAYALEKIYKKSYLPLEKKMYVYLPYRYDSTKRYNVLYLMHGGIEDEGYWFAKGKYEKTDKQKYTDVGNVTQNLVDHLIKEKKIEPLIIVTPSFCENIEEYQRRKEYPQVYFEVVNHFWRELEQDIMPYIQIHYSTYSEAPTKEAFKKARDHTAFAGVSQGSIISLYSVMLHMLDRFSYIGSISAGSIQHKIDEKGFHVELNEKKLEEICNALKQGPKLGYWYNGCGVQDVMYPTHRETYDRLMKQCANELCDDKGDEENCIFCTHPEGKHHYRSWIYDLSNILQIFFGYKKEAAFLEGKENMIWL